MGKFFFKELVKDVNNCNIVSVIENEKAVRERLRMQITWWQPYDFEALNHKSESHITSKSLKHI